MVIIFSFPADNKFMLFFFFFPTSMWMFPEFSQLSFDKISLWRKAIELSALDPQQWTPLGPLAKPSSPYIGQRHQGYSEGAKRQVNDRQHPLLRRCQGASGSQWRSGEWFIWVLTRGSLIGHCASSREPTLTNEPSRAPSLQEQPDRPSGLHC